MVATEEPAAGAPRAPRVDETDESVVVLFSTQLRPDAPIEDYTSDAGRMVERVRQMPGFLSMKRYTSDDGEAITLALFESEAALEAWRTDAEHVAVQQRGRDEYYDAYWVHVCSTIRKYRYVAPDL